MKLQKIWEKGDYRQDLGIEKDFFDIFLEKANRAERILDAGAGAGRMIRILKNHGVDADFTALDITTHIEDAPAKNRVTGDARALPFKDNSFDLTYSLGVIEHFPETSKALEEIVRVTKKRGYILVTVPRRGPWTIIRKISYYIRKDFRLGTFEEVRGRNLKEEDLKVDDIKVEKIGPVGEFYLLGIKLPFKAFLVLIGEVQS